MRFKRHFWVFALAWAFAVLAVSDILLISAFRNIDLDTDRMSPVWMMIIVSFAFAALGRMLAEVFPRLLIRRLRRNYLALEGVGEYAFFRNYALVLALGAAANTVFLYFRYRSVMEILIKDEDRRLRLMYSSDNAYLLRRLQAMSERVDACDVTAVILTVLLLLLKAAAYLFLARALVAGYHKHARSAYAQEVSDHK
ncbi:MAG: hypothetical protein IKO27_09590 [Ruminococcus sp.]|nr:hypothetical protein [Ruminococcus sp.]